MKTGSMPLDVRVIRLVVPVGAIVRQAIELVALSPYAGATANEIDWNEKVTMQGKIQKWVDHSISVTINLPADISVEAVESLSTWSIGIP